MNEAFTEVLNAPELPIGRIRAVKVDDRSVAISHTARGFFATTTAVRIAAVRSPRGI